MLKLRKIPLGRAHPASEVGKVAQMTVSGFIGRFCGVNIAQVICVL